MGLRGWVFLGVAVPVLGLLGLLAWASLGDEGPTGIGVNREFGRVAWEPSPAADFRLELPGNTGRLPPGSVNGISLSLSDLSGKVVLVDFWASWCAPCRQEAPTLGQVYREYAGQPVEFVGVNIWDRPGDAQQYLETFNLPYPNGIDAGGTIAIDYGVKGIPEKFFVDRQGIVQRKYVGPIPPDVLRATLDELLAAPDRKDQ